MDRTTLAAISVLGYLLAVALHEHGGHTLACVALGAHPQALGAFYVDCDAAGLSDAGQRLVALAGPMVSLLLGLSGYAWLSRLHGAGTGLRYLAWLLGSLGWMEATGYLLFSGVSGLGDLGTTRDGALYAVPLEPLVRVLMVLLAALAYRGVMRRMWRRWTDTFGQDEDQRSARQLTLLAYLSGAAMYLAIGLLNPKGLEILLISVLPSSLGGTYGLLGMWRFGVAGAAGEGKSAGGASAFSFPLARSWPWITGAAAAALAYALAFGTG